jgi:hypothetical protein
MNPMPKLIRDGLPEEADELVENVPETPFIPS